MDDVQFVLPNLLWAIRHAVVKPRAVAMGQSFGYSMDDLVRYSTFALPVRAPGFSQAGNLLEDMSKLRHILQDVGNS